MGNRVPALDGLRGVAVSVVVAFHCCVWFYGTPDLGWFGREGVRLFFVLSGFLITGILLRARADPPGKALRGFYKRRALRIFPIYYLTLLVAVAIGTDGARESWPWASTYTVNWHMVATEKGVGSLTHFWSLAVEEQFYLFWPMLVLLVRRSWLPWLVVGLYLTGVTFRASCIVAGATGSDFWLATPACFDALGVGAMVAWALWTRARASWAWPGYVGAAVVACYIIGPRSGAVSWLTLALDQALLAWLGWLVWRAVEGRTGTLLELAPVCYVGRISYGLYVYHPFVMVAVWPLAGTVAAVACAVAVAALSWRYVEAPLLATSSARSPSRLPRPAS